MEDIDRTSKTKPRNYEEEYKQAFEK